MVVECSCVVEKIAGKDATRRKTTLPQSVCTLPIITHFLPRAHCEFTALQENRYLQLDMCMTAKMEKEIKNVALLIINHFLL